MMNDYGTFTLAEIAKILGLSKERVREIETQGLKKLKHPKFCKKWDAIKESMGAHQ